MYRIQNIPVLNFSLLLWLAVVLCLAWAVGAYSRLNRMREQAQRARASLLKYCKLYPVLTAQWQTRLGMVDVWSAASAMPVGMEHNTALLQLFAAVRALQTPLTAWEASAGGAKPHGGLGGALDAVQSCVDALASAPDDLAGALWPTDERSRWLDLAADIRIRRGRYNVYASELNEAALQMPAAIMARLLGIQMWELV